ncbi:MAG: acyl-CoA dehydrogenase [Actinobacteria bacterium]|nr:MAG: acyl-CoA dehydrogenase [Actinomycetota bacterium]
MDFSRITLEDATKAFWKEVRAFCAEHVTEEVLEEERRTGAGFNEALHFALAERGWLTPDWPVEDGGAALDPLRHQILVTELRRSNAPLIVAGTTVLTTIGVRDFADEALKADVLRKVASGHVRICLGYTEPDTGSDLAGVRTRATRDGNEWVISGQKMFTTGAQVCQYSFLLARSNPDAPKHRGLTMFLVPLDRAGVQITGIGTLGGERTNFVYYDDVRIGDDHRLGPADEGWAVLSGTLGAEHGTNRRGRLGLREPDESYVSTTRELLGAVSEWARDTRDEHGRRVLDDPFARVRLAEVALDVEVSGLVTGPSGRILSSELLIRDAADLLDLVGPAGLVQHGERGAVADGFPEYAHRYAQGTAIYGGSTDIHRNMIAERYLGLPRSTPKG